MTVTIVPAIPISKARASSDVPWKASGERGPMPTSDSSAPAASAASTDSVGSTHSDPRTYSASASRRIMPSLPHARPNRGPVSTKHQANANHPLARAWFPLIERPG